MKNKLVLVQLGSPKGPKVSEVRSYLKEFLGDPRVVDLPAFFWKIILYLFVLPFRPKRSAKLYSHIWQKEGFPLVRYTESLAQKMRNQGHQVEYAFLLGERKLAQVFDAWEAQGCPEEKWVVTPLFPQYAEATTASGLDAWGSEIKKRVQVPDFYFVSHFHRSKAFIDGSVRQIKKLISSQNPDVVLISFHGIPTRRVLVKKDPYYKHCFETFLLIKKQLDHNHIEWSFQSRFGQEEWLGPSTEEKAIELAQAGHKKIAVYCPSFVADCLETIDEIGRELNHSVTPYGSSIIPIPCLNDDDEWARDFAHYLTVKASDHSQSANLEYDISPQELAMMPEQKMQSPPLDAHAKKVIKIIFLTLFLDLVGFSIIFPLFPALAKYYLALDAHDPVLKVIFHFVDWLRPGMDPLSPQSLVLFGGALGALYSFLQFIAAPLWGGISDKIGRRPVLLISMIGLAASYILWFFSGTFTTLALARFVGGIMGGNISTATAVVADVTQEKNRSKGMAFIGIAFALGFILGPAIGGLTTHWNLLDTHPEWATLGVNPFSIPALVAFVLSLFNIFSLWKRFPETLPPQNRGKASHTRSINPLVLFKPLPYPGLAMTIYAHFLFLLSFSGMEFTLTFLTAERMGMGPRQNAGMFVFIGLIMVLIQGGVVRRQASKVGEKKMALAGLVSIVPGLFILSNAYSVGLLYLGLFFLAIGSAMAIPCLTALASRYAPSDVQGQALGNFRSLGALARVIGPLAASLVYWRFGSATPYILGALFLMIPIGMALTLPRPLDESAA